MPTKIYLLRHGQALHNVAAPDQDINDEVFRDAQLTEAGHAEAVALKTHINGIRFDAIYCSPLQRCRQTLKTAYPRSVYLPVELDDRLLEQPYGSYISNKRQEKGDLISSVPINWESSHVAEINPHFLTDKKDEYNVIKDFVEEIIRIHPDESVLLVSHGRWINRFLKTYCGVSRFIRNCELLEVTLALPPLSNIINQEPAFAAEDEVDEPRINRFKSN